MFDVVQVVDGQVQQLGETTQVQTERRAPPTLGRVLLDAVGVLLDAVGVLHGRV